MCVDPMPERRETVTTTGRDDDHTETALAPLPPEIPILGAVSDDGDPTGYVV